MSRFPLAPCLAPYGLFFRLLTPRQCIKSFLLIHMEACPRLFRLLSDRQHAEPRSEEARSAAPAGLIAPLELHQLSIRTFGLLGSAVCILEAHQSEN
jgi:hypothetical protein